MSKKKKKKEKESSIGLILLGILLLGWYKLVNKKERKLYKLKKGLEKSHQKLEEFYNKDAIKYGLTRKEYDTLRSEGKWLKWRENWHKDRGEVAPPLNPEAEERIRKRREKNPFVKMEIRAMEAIKKANEKKSNSCVDTDKSSGESGGLFSVPEETNSTDSKLT